MPRRFTLLFLGLFLLATAASTQPVNNDCSGAIALDDGSDWCSGTSEFTFQGATTSGAPAASCFMGTNADLWFSFTPNATEVSITTIGNLLQGSLESAFIVLYTGSCGALEEVGCSPGSFFSTVNELTVGGLSLGQTYYLRLQADPGRAGAFQLCVNNYNAPTEPSADCPTAAVLCDKESFVVRKTFGAGNNATEANDADCLAGFGTNVESHSTWFVWTAGSTGSLTFNLRPLNPPDDLDFVVYEFPNGPGDCSGKIPLRCMASSCDGSTGLNLNSTDTSEPPNCSLASQDNFLAALQMEEGKTYGMMVNNFSTTGIGYEVEFGGTAEFAGPEPDILFNGSSCTGEPITFTDGSTFAEGNIVGWEWEFGPGASPASSSSPGPHEVVYDSPGTKQVLLRLRTSQGCTISWVEEVEVQCCDGEFQVETTVNNPSCHGSSDGAISLSVSNNAPPYTYEWETGNSGSALEGLPAGTYSVTITDANSCFIVLPFSIMEPAPLTVETTLGRPTCNGGTDGTISVQVEGGIAPYTFSWNGAAPSSDAALSGLPAGEYNLLVQDASGCEQNLLIALQELELELDPSVQATRNPSCSGLADGGITVSIANGRPPFEYDFNDGNGFVGENVLEGLPAGTYEVEVQDANLCRGSFAFELQNPEPLSVEILEEGISCFGVDDGMLAAVPGGGTPPYTYQWSTGAESPEINGLSPGTYSLALSDDKGCELQEEYEMESPEVLAAKVEEVQPASCFGASSGSILLSVEGGQPPFTYSLNGQDFQGGPRFEQLPAGTYTPVVRDANGCMGSTSAEIIQPPPLLVDAGPDVSLTLGEDTHLRALANDAMVSYSWSPADSLSCTDCPSPLIKPLQNRVYRVTATDGQGCTATDSLLVRVIKDYPVYVPNAFSPNGDGRNDFFTIFGGPALRQALSFEVFDRWGAAIFRQENLSADNPVLGWDGKIKNQPAPTGVYTYVIRLEFIDSEIRTLAGDVSIIR